MKQIIPHSCADNNPNLSTDYSRQKKLNGGYQLEINDSQIRGEKMCLPGAMVITLYA